MSRLIALVFVLLWAPLAAGPHATAAETPALVDSAWLKANLDRPDLVVLDVRNALAKQSRQDYLQGHVPGAIHSDYLKAGWRTKVDGIAGQLPRIADLEALIGGLGIDNDNHVVVVAGGKSALDMGSATRVFFTFKVLGHDQVSVLDGGHKAWAADSDNPLETGEVTRPATIFTADFRPELLASRDEVAAAAGKGTALIDFRPTPQYQGKAKHKLARVPGTIPGAVSVPEGELTEKGGTLVAGGKAAELIKLAGIEPEDEAIAFCNTGHWASLGWFVSHEVLGNKAAKLYDGSMVDWTADQSRPVEAGGS